MNCMGYFTCVMSSVTGNLCNKCPKQLVEQNSSYSDYFNVISGFTSNSRAQGGPVTFVLKYNGSQYKDFSDLASHQLWLTTPFDIQLSGQKQKVYNEVKFCSHDENHMKQVLHSAYSHRITACSYVINISTSTSQRMCVCLQFIKCSWCFWLMVIILLVYMKLIF